MSRRTFLSLASSLALCLPLIAQEADDKAAKERAREERLAAMRQIAERFTVQVTEEDKSRQVPLLEAPILRFNDPAREFHDATLWAWGDKGRPVCLLAIEQYGDQWFECISLTDGTLAADADKLKWRPKAAGLTLAPLPDAPPPAMSSARRMAQMKELLGKLSTYEVGKTGSRYELRLMARPLHRYQDPQAGLQDGAIFAFAYGTNPELLAVIEARGTESESKWGVGFARCGTAEPHVLLDKTEIFTLPYARGTTAADPYWNFAYRFAEKK
jgi:hypothetical protein